VTLRLAPLVVDAVDPAAVEAFWAAALPPAQRALLSNRWQWRRADPSELDVRRSPDGALIDPQGNEFSVLNPPASPAG
jgi:hypothetical protein